ncbi:MAG: four helix bundle protein [Anaerolineales bacterium]|nr:four helix bundle protein [Anaerolineales bacterium]
MKELPFEEWVKTLPDSLRNDPLWKSAYYRLSMYLYDLMWIDVEVINKDFRGREIVHQLVRSAGSVCANMEEAYRRGIGTADYVRIMRIALGELGETQGWYFRARHILGSDLLEKRIKVIQQAIALTVKVIDQNRRKK